MPGFEPLRRAKPVRNADTKSLRGIERTFFVTYKTIEGRHLLQSEGMAMLFIDGLRSYVAQRKFVVHDFCRDARACAFAAYRGRVHEHREGSPVRERRLL